MEKEITNIKISDEIVIVDGYAFEIDRSEPKIGEYVGEGKDLVFPEITANVTLSADGKTATIHITAKEEENGINKIEIWQLGEMIKEYTYENIKTEITVNPPYEAKQNGKYTIKVYGNLIVSKTVTVEGIKATVGFEPNGNEEWKKSHSTKVTIQETADKVVSARYYWINSVEEPADNKFTKEHTFNNGEIITVGEQENLTGTYYLWIMLETQLGEKLKCRSEGFNFDNQGPNVTSFIATPDSVRGVTVSATVQDMEAGVVRFEFYVDDVLKGSETYTEAQGETLVSKTIETGPSSNFALKIVTFDAAGNYSSRITETRTMLYRWEKWEVGEVVTDWECKQGARTGDAFKGSSLNSATFNPSTGTFRNSGTSYIVRRKWVASDLGGRACGTICLH